MTTDSNASKKNVDVFYEGPITHNVYFDSYFLRGLLAVAGLALFIYIKAKGYADWKNYFSYVGLVMLLVGVIGVAITYLRVKSTKWKITNMSIELESGILSKKIDSLEVYRIKDIAYQQSLLQRMSGLGQINIISTDATDPILEIIGVPNHRALYDKIKAAIEMRRSEGRVMSFENMPVDTHGHGH